MRMGQYFELGHAPGPSLTRIREARPSAATSPTSEFGYAPSVTPRECLCNIRKPKGAYVQPRGLNAMYRVEADGARRFVQTRDARWPWGCRQGPVGTSRPETDCVKVKECEQRWGEVVPGTGRRPQRRLYECVMFCTTMTNDDE